MVHNAHLPIGVFDSGMGGLTVLRELVALLPQETFVYLGDTARLPYGTKSQETVQQYAAQMARILEEQPIKLLVVACNTATTAALPYLRQLLPHLPIVGVVEPGARTAANHSANNRVIVLATETTIRSGIYQKTLLEINPKLEIIAQPCGLFVALAEEGCVDNDVAHAAISHYLSPLQARAQEKDCVLLGCTHFPVLLQPLTQFFAGRVTIVDSAKATALAVRETLQHHVLDRELPSVQPAVRFLVTDLPERFVRLGQIFFGEPIDSRYVELVDQSSKASTVSL